MSQHVGEDAPFEAEYGPVKVLFGARRGKYPDGNTLVVRGERECVVIDPSLGLHNRDEPLPRADRVLLSHCHEDHTAGLSLFPSTSVHLHRLDRPALSSLESLRDHYGYPDAALGLFIDHIVEKFHYQPRPDALAFEDGENFDLGGVEIRVIHTPGHTGGHSCLLIEWREAGEARGMLYLGDIDLTNFGPYYGDACSNLEDFEQSISRVRQIKTNWYATYHHIGLIEGYEAFAERLEIFESAIGRREAALMEFLEEPRDMEEIVARRFIFRPESKMPHFPPVEQISMQAHIDRLIRQGRLRVASDGRYAVR